MADRHLVYSELGLVLAMPYDPVYNKYLQIVDC